MWVVIGVIVKCILKEIGIEIVNYIVVFGGKEIIVFDKLIV